MRSYDLQSMTIVSDNNTGPLRSSSRDSQEVLRWHRVGGPRECILSIIEVNTHGPSSINLKPTIDNNFHHSHLAVGNLFTPPSVSHNVVADVTPGDSDTKTVANVDNRCTLKTASTSADNLQAEESTQSPRATDYTLHRYLNTGHLEEGKNLKSEISVTMHQEDWSDDDCTDL